MKYIKTYEKHNPKFNIGDVVEIIDEPYIYYIIDGYDYREKSMIKDVCRLKRYEDRFKLANKEGFYIWKLEEYLQLVPDYKINSMKYNL